MNAPATPSPGNDGRLTRRRMLGVVGASVAIAGAIGYEAFYREIFLIDVERVAVRLPRFKGAFRLIQISDLHYKSGRAPCESLAEQIRSLNPQIIAITGDLIGTMEGLKKVDALLKALPRPCFVVPGNWEHYLNWRLDEQAAFYAKRGVEFLLNRSLAANFGSGVTIVGVDDPFRGLDDLEAALKDADPEKPAILLAHSPLIAPQAARTRRIDLALCGHTHGGHKR